MSKLLASFEEDFLKDTEELLKDYTDHELIFETLDVCTNRQLGKSNYTDRFSGVFECIRGKMYQLCESSEQIERNSATEQHIPIPGIINTQIIVRAFLRGYKHIKHKIEEIAIQKNISLDAIQHKKEIGILIVLTILARSNLDENFKEK